MSVTVNDLKTQLRVVSDADSLMAERCFSTADDLVGKYLVDALVSNPPESVIDQAKMAVAVEIFNQNKAPNGVLNQVYDVGNGETVSTPLRIGADPMRPARPLLRQWLSIPVA